MHAIPLAFQRLKPRPGAIGLAVSGGGDSMAMLHLIARARPHIQPHGDLRVEVATIDHGLRPEAAEEAQFVADTANALGFPHQTLIWKDHPATGNLMQAASRARLDLLAAWAHQRDISHIFLAHTADDQAETFLMGLSRAAGLDGLTGMRPRFDHNGVTFWREMLGWDRAMLRDFLTRNGLTWCEDPSNSDARYARVRIRKALPGLAPLGITLRELNETISNLANVQELLRHTTAEAFTKFGREEAGGLHFNRETFTDSPSELQRRLLVAAIRWISGNRHPPRGDAICQVLSEISRRRGTTLGGCLIRVTPREIRILREPQATAPAMPWRPGLLWDNRWRISGPEAPDLEIRALSTEGLAQLPDWRRAGFRRDSLLVSPGLWQGDRLLSSPLLPQFSGEWRASVYPSFGSFILSH